MKIGEKIRIVRESKQITVDVMAGVLNMSISNYHKIERGEIDLNTEKIFKIAERLEIEPYKLLMDEGLTINVFQNSDRSGYGVYNDFGNSKLIELLEDKIKLISEKMDLIVAENTKLKHENELLKAKIK